MVGEARSTPARAGTDMRSALEYVIVKSLKGLEAVENMLRNALMRVRQ